MSGVPLNILFFDCFRNPQDRFYVWNTNLYCQFSFPNYWPCWDSKLTELMPDYQDICRCKFSQFNSEYICKHKGRYKYGVHENCSPPTPLVRLRPKFFHPLGLGRPISNEYPPNPPSSPNNNQSIKRKHYLSMAIIYYQVFPSGRLLTSH